MTYDIVLLDVLPDARLASMRALMPEGFTLTGATARDPASLYALVREADFIISGQVDVTGELLRATTRVKLVHKWGVGVDNFDVATARELGISIARTPGSNALPVAEFTLGLMLSTLRFMGYAHERLKNGVWHGPGRLPGETFLLSGRTVGIIGLGAIGSHVARLLRPFGCTLLYTKRNPLPAAEEEALGVRYAGLDEIISTADVISLHCPLTPETTGLIDTSAFARMKRSAVLINVARGGVVNEADLFVALRDRVIHGAAMDVFSLEPLPADSPLLTLDNIVLTPHLAATTADTFAPTLKRIFANIARVARGEPVAAGDLVV